MIKFDNEEKQVMKLYLYIMASALALVLTITFTGCSTISLAKQKKAAMLIGQQIEFVGDNVLVKCNDGTLKEDDCNTMADLINFALDAQNAYTKALIAIQDSTGTQEQAQKALEVLQNDVATLVSNAIGLGIKFREEKK